MLIGAPVDAMRCAAHCRLPGDSWYACAFAGAQHVHGISLTAQPTSRVQPNPNMRPLALKLIGFFGAFETFLGVLLIIAGVIASIVHAYHTAFFPFASKFHFGVWTGIFAIFVGACAVLSSGRKARKVIDLDLVCG